MRARKNVQGVPRPHVLLLPISLHTAQYKAPGGGQEEGESPEQCAIREFREEAGPTLQRVQRLGSERVGNHEKLFFGAAHWSGILRDRVIYDGAQRLLVPRWIEVTPALLMSEQVLETHREGLYEAVRWMAGRCELFYWPGRSSRIILPGQYQGKTDSVNRRRTEAA